MTIPHPVSRCSTSAWHLRRAALAVHHGGVIAYPTEAVFGLGCDPLDPEAAEQLLRLKQRNPGKGLILIAAEYDALRPFLAPGAETILATRGSGWPGPYTWLLPAAAHTPVWLDGGSGRLAVRVTAHPVAAALCRTLDGALVSTSANLTRHAPARSALEVRLRFGNRLDYIVPGTIDHAARPTPVRDAVTGELLRA